MNDMRPNSLSARDVAYHVHPQTNLHVHLTQGPLVITRGEGVQVFDDNGKAYIDAMAGLWSASLGFSERRLAKAAYDQMCELPYSSTFAHRSHPKVIELSEKLVAMAPASITRAMFANSGSEAIDTALKLVWYYHNATGRPQKKKVIAREKAYHGSTIASASLTGLERMQREFDLPIAGVLRAPCPHYWRNGHDGESEDAFAQRMADEIEAIILREGADTVGAFFAEPLQAAGGVIPPPKGYHRLVQALCKKYDILFVADEVVCGFGRTGTMWGSETYDIQPDMMTCAKSLSASYLPISALMISERIFQALLSQSEKIGQFGHGFTYAGHPVSVAVALETLAIYEERDLVARATELSPVLQDGLRALGDHPLIGEVRGVGLIAGVELVADKNTKAPFDTTAGMGTKVMAAAQAKGLLVRALGDTIAFCPPLTISETELQTVISRFADSLEEVHHAHAA